MIIKCTQYIKHIIRSAQICANMKDLICLLLSLLAYLVQLMLEVQDRLFKTFEMS